MAKSIASITPPLTPVDFSENADDDELDYMNFLNSDAEIKENEGGDNSYEVVENEKHLLFSCKGEINPKGGLRENSFLGCRFLDNLLSEGKPLKFFVLFSDLAFSSDILYENLSHCFMTSRKSIQLLERNSHSFCHVDSEWDKKNPYEARKMIVDIFVGLSFLLNDLSIEDDLGFIQTIISEIKELIRFLGPLHFLPPHVTNASSSLGNKCTSASYHLFHLHLDVRWWSLCILHQMEWKFGKEIFNYTNTNFVNEVKCQPLNNEDGEETLSVFSQLLKIIVWDIFTLLERQTAKASLLESINLPSFPCTCSYELSVLVLHLVEWRHKYYKQKSFWSIVNSKLLILLKLKNNISIYNELQQTASGFSFPPPTFKDVNFYVVWKIFTSIAKLFQFDNLGFIHLAEDSIKSETKMLRTLIKSSLNPNVLSPAHSSEEEHMRFYLRCCYSLFELWKNEKEGRHSDWVVCLWDYFCKALDQPFLLKGNSLEGFATLSKTPSKVAEQVKNLVDGEIEKNETSWSTFLRILGSVLKHYDKEWRILNGRIYIKFHSKRMAELSNIGLHNTTLLFLTLAWSKDMTVCTKLCQLLSDVPDNAPKKLITVFQSLTATAYLLSLKNCHLGVLTETIEKKILSIAHQCSLAADLTEKRDFGHAVVMLCNGLQEVMEVSSDLTLGHNNLYSSALSNFCSQASVIEQGSILSFVEAGLSKVMRATMHLQSLADGTGLDIVETLWCNFQSYIKSQLLSLTPPRNLGSICASLVLCASRLQILANMKSNISEASCLFLYIIDNEIISGRVALQFICNLLKEEFSNEYLSKICEKYDEKLIGLLLMNMIESGNSDDVMVASEAIFSTPKLNELISSPPACPFAAFQMLIQSLSREFGSSNSFHEKLKLKEKAQGYTNSLDKHLQNFIKKMPLPSHFPQVIELVACIISNGGSLFYVKGKSDCLIAKLISSVILPTSVFNLEKPLGSLWTDALSQALPKVIFGISSLWHTSDNYISRCLRDIFSKYTHRFPFTSHPFMSVLCDENLQHFEQIRNLFIDTTIQSFFLTKSNCNLAHKQMATSLLLEILEKCEEFWWFLYCETVFPALLEFILGIEDNHTKKLATDLLKKIMDLSEIYCSSVVIVEHIRKFVMCNMPWNSGKVFRILDVLSVLNPNIMSEALPGIAEAIKIIEEKRGSGSDQALRKGFRPLTERLNTGYDLLQ